MPGLKNSRWALHDHRDARDARSSSVPAPLRHQMVDASTAREDNSAHARIRQPRKNVASAAAELSRYSKIVRRMKWKLPFLDLAYRQATSEHGLDDAGKAEAELMFKLDFFDYYMLCERALVHLQGVFGITISRDSTAQGETARHHTSSRQREKQQKHRYHANVLGALDREDNPLHAVLGVGDVRWHLSRAKDLRNHWKNIDDDIPTGTRAHSRESKRRVPLATYDLAGILASIHQGLDRAYVVASEYAASCTETQSNTDATKSERMPIDTAHCNNDDDDDEWGFMVDAMDWEAV